jgi:hypothetical protein
MIVLIILVLAPKKEVLSLPIITKSFLKKKVKQLKNKEIQNYNYVVLKN